MLELQNINQNLIQRFQDQLFQLVKRKKYILLVKAVEYAVYKEVPNAPKYLITPIISKMRQTLISLKDRKIENFKSEKEAQEFYKTNYCYFLDIADKNLISQEFSNMIYMSYDLCKYDKKIIYKDTEHFFNISYLFNTHRAHQKAYKKWIFLNEIKKGAGEHNINISHNTNNTLENQLKFIYEPYKLYKNHSLSNDLSKEIDLNIIDGFKEDKHMMARAINEISTIKYNLENFKKHSHVTTVKSFNNLQAYLNSDIQVEKSDIVNSWLTYIAFLYIKVNPSKIPKAQLSKYIKTIVKATTDIHKDIDKDTSYNSRKLSTATFREFGQFNNTRLLEITDNRRKLTRSEESIKHTERFINNISSYIAKNITK